MPASPLDNTDGPLGVTINVGGQPVGDELALLSVVVTQDEQEPARAVLVFRDSDPALSDYPLMDDDDLMPGAAITVSGRYGGGAAQPVFTGTIAAKRFAVSNENGLTTSLICDGVAAGRLPDQMPPAAMAVTFGEDIIDVDLTLNKTGAITGHCRYQGATLAGQGDSIALHDAGRVNSGPFLVTGITHEMRDGNWTTTARLLRPAPA